MHQAACAGCLQCGPGLEQDRQGYVVSHDSPPTAQTRRTVQNTELAVHGKCCLDLNLGSLRDLWVYGNESSL